jgi:hypothetical protein
MLHSDPAPICGAEVGSVRAWSRSAYVAALTVFVMAAM